MSAFTQQLDDIKRDFVDLCSDVELLFKLSFTIPKDNINLSELKKMDTSIDIQEIDLEKKCQAFLALHQPVASDLRFILSILKATNYLERIADLSINIAKRNSRLVINERIHNLNIPTIVDVVVDMLRESIDALVHRRADIAYAVIEKDEQVDVFKSTAREITISEIKNTPAEVETYMDLFLNARHLERIADLATNIAEDAVYLVEGKIIRHTQLSD